MALKSGGTIPAARPIIDSNQAIALLATVHHWQASKHNSGGRVRYDVTITHAGRRVSASAVQFPGAVSAALAKLRAVGPGKGAAEIDTVYMRLAR